MDTRVRFPRPWRSAPDLADLAVSYRCEGDSATPALIATIEGVEISLDDPARLEPVVIDKPWGREIWYSGIEARGESRIVGSGGSVALSSYLALAPLRLCGRRPLVLLKILDPRPEPLLGELYLEVHAEKREVYVVTALDPTAWPEGRGRIRYGIDQSCRQQFGNDEAFREAFANALIRYERARAALDESPDSAALATEERSAREATLEFTASRELSVGDVITVPNWLPHSLQHGVQVVEFQTPTYERFILSSSQRVLTQAHWDSTEAVRRLSLDPPPVEITEPVGPGIERIARFDDFGVWRINPAAQRQIRLPAAVPYALAFCIEGELLLTGRTRSLLLQAGEAAFVPLSAVDQPIRAGGDRTTLGLLAAPGL